MTFRATLTSSGRTATGIEVPDAVVAALGGGKRPKVTATVAGYVYRSSVGTMNDVAMLPVSAEVRAGAGIAAGDEVEVDLQLDDQPREVAVPDDLTAALAGQPEAQRFFAGLSYSNQRRLVLAVEGAKTSETRDRRIATTVSRLADGVA